MATKTAKTSNATEGKWYVEDDATRRTIQPVADPETATQIDLIKASSLPASVKEVSINALRQKTGKPIKIVVARAQEAGKHDVVRVYFPNGRYFGAAADQWRAVLNAHTELSAALAGYDKLD